MDNNDFPYRKDFGEFSEQAKKFWRENIEPIQARLRLEQANATKDDMVMERINRIIFDSYMSVWESRSRKVAEILGQCPDSVSRHSDAIKKSRLETISFKRSPLSDVSFPATGDFFPEELL